MVSPVSGLLDSGATTSLLLATSVLGMSLPTQSTQERRVTFAAGEPQYTSTSTLLGEQEALVLPVLTHNLISPNQALAAGGSLTLSQAGGALTNSSNTSTIPIRHESNLWLCDLEDVRRFRSFPTSSLVEPTIVDPVLLHGAIVRPIFIDPAILQNRQRHQQARAVALSASSSMARTSSLYFERDVDDPPPMRSVHPALRQDAFSASGRILKITGADVMARFIEGHERSGHLNYKAMQKAVSGDHPAWTNFGLTFGQIGRCGRAYSCPHCILARRKRDSIPINREVTSVDGSSSDLNRMHLSSTNAKPGEIISMDPNGPVSPATSAGRKLWFLFKDVATQYDHAIVASEQTLEAWKQAVTIVFDWYIGHGVKPRILRTDFAKVPLSNDFRAWILDKYGTICQSSAPYAHWQNAVERDVQTVVAGTATLLHSQRWLRADSWDLALAHFIDLRNRSPNSRIRDNRSPHQVLTGESTDFSQAYRFAFGDLLACALPGNLPGEAKTWKFDVKNELGIYVGNPSDIKRASLVYWPRSHSVSVRLHCWKLDMTDEQFISYYNRRGEMQDGSIPFARVVDAVTDFNELVRSDSADELVTPSVTPLLGSVPLSDEQSLKSIRDQYPTSNTRVTRSSSRLHDTVSSSAAIDYIPSDYNSISSSSTDVHGAYMFEHGFSVEAAKVTVGLALKSPDADLWIEAMIKEVESLIRGGTLEPVHRADLAGAYKILHTTAQLKLKLHQDGSVDKYKCRLCACGNELYGQINETYSPTVSALAHSVVHQIAITDRMETCLVDIVQAYLHQIYPTDALPLYVTLPDNLARACGLECGALYRIRKYLYGLPDAGLAYYKAYSSHLISGGYLRTISDPCLFVKSTSAGRTYVWCHVDDTFVAADSPLLLQSLRDHIATRFEITYTESVTEYLGVKLTKQSNGDVILSQPKLLDSLAEEYADELSSFRHQNAPQVLETSEAGDDTPYDRTKYLHLVGALLYLTKSRPDIQTAVSFGASHSASPTRDNFYELLRCLSYLISTHDHGLRIIAGEAHRPLRLTCYTDASYLTHSDSKSHSGYTLSFGTVGTFFSKSGKQQLVATSSTHSELRGLYTLVIDLVFVIHLCDELFRPLDLPSIVFVDNQPVIDLVSQPSGQTKVRRCKHFLMLVDWVREQVLAGYLELVKVPTKENVADILTKIIVGSEFRAKSELLLG